MNEITHKLCAPTLRENVASGGHICMEAYSIPVEVAVENISATAYPIAVFGGGKIVDEDGKSTPVEQALKLSFDMVAMNEFPYARKAIAELAGVQCSLTDRVKEGTVVCFVTGCGTVRLWETHGLIIEHRSQAKDPVMMELAISNGAKS